MEIKPLIPFFGVARQYKNLRDEILNASDKVYSTGQVLDGNFTKEFETQIARRCHRRYAVAVNSGTQGLVFAQQTLFNKNVKILVPSISFVATINSVLMSGNEVVFCDTDDQALINLESLDYAIKGAGVAGIMYVNAFGNTVDWDRFRIMSNFFNSGLKVIEDAAQSFGASFKGQPSGSLGDISILSFDPTKNLNNYGSGGMILCDDRETFNTLLNLRDNGKRTGYEVPGTNSKMSESDCAQMLVKLNHFDAWQKRRAEIAEYYTTELEEYVDVPQVTEGAIHAWHKYVIRTDKRESLKMHLSMQRIETKVHYRNPLFEEPVGYPYINYASELYREASAFCQECLSLPIYPELQDFEVERVVDSIIKFF